MRKHPIRCGFMCPLRIALTLGQVAHATSGVKSGGDGVCGSKKKCFPIALRHTLVVLERH